LNPRELSVGELAVLEMIQIGYGPQNTESQVFFNDSGEAAKQTFAADNFGSTPEIRASICRPCAIEKPDGRISAKTGHRRVRTARHKAVIPCSRRLGFTGAVFDAAKRSNIITTSVTASAVRCTSLGRRGQSDRKFYLCLR
jgi:hypothetical protein